MLYKSQKAIVFIATVHKRKVKTHTSASLIKIANLNFKSNKLIIIPEIKATIPMLNPIHGIYIKPPELYKNPTKSPKKHATKPYNGPIIIPVIAEKNKVSENCVSANLNSKNILQITISSYLLE